MKRFLVPFALLLLLAGTGTAQVPSSMSYQGYVTDNAGTPLPNGNYSFTFSLYTVEVGGTHIWTENHPTVAVNKGLFNVMLGRGAPANPLTLLFDVQYFLGIATGVDPEMSPRVRLNTNAYSFHARTAEGVVDGAITNAGVAGSAGILASKLQPTVLTESEVVAGTGINVANAGGTLTISTVPGGVTLNGDVTGPAGSNTIANNAVNAAKIAPGQVVKGLNGLQDNVTLAAGANISIVPAGQILTISATGGGGGLTLPYSEDVTSGITGFDIEQLGTGRAGWLHINNATSAADALYVSTNSTSTTSTGLKAAAVSGRAIEATNNSATMGTLYAYNSGAGPVATFGNSSTSTGNIVEISKNGGAGRGLSMTYGGTGSAVYVDNNSSGAGLELKQDGTGNAGYFHIDNATSSSNCLRAVTSSTNGSSDALEVVAAAGNGLDATSTGTLPTIRAQNNNASATAPIMQLYSSIANQVLEVDRSGNVDAAGNVSADTYTATTTLNTGTPVAGRLYKDNVIYAWGRIDASGAFSGQSFGIQSVTRSNTDSSYLITFKTTFASVDDYAITVTPYAAANFELAVAAPQTANTCKVYIRWLTISSSSVLLRKYYDDFFIIVAGRP